MIYLYIIQDVLVCELFCRIKRMNFLKLQKVLQQLLFATCQSNKNALTKKEFEWTALHVKQPFPVSSLMVLLYNM